MPKTAADATNATELSTSTIELSSGASIYMHRAGDADELVVFLHAVGGDHSSWAGQVEETSKSFTCISYDMRAHGRSKAPAKGNGKSSEISIAAFAHDLAELIQLSGFARAHLVGLSMGGVVALQLLEQQPELVQSLALANTWCFMEDGDARIKFIENQLSNKTMPQSSAELIPNLLAPGTAKEIIDAAVKAEGSKDVDVFLDSWRSMFKVDFRNLLKRIDVPIVLIGGSIDPVTPSEPLLTYMHGQLPMSWYVNIEGASHFTNLDHPEEFNRILRMHLRRSRSNKSQRTTAPVVRLEKIPANTTAEALMYTLSRRGVDYFFSNSGTDFTPIIDAMARYENDPGFKIKTVAAPHENTAIGMAHGYFLLSGKAQVTMAHVNVGTANMGLGIINANRSRIPVLVMAGRTPIYEQGVPGCRTNFVQWGQDTFDQGAYFREFYKWDYELKGAHNLETIVDRAMAISQSDPCGPVYLSLPKEPLCEKIDNVHISVSPRQNPSPPLLPDLVAVERAAQALLKAKRPLVVTSEIGRFRRGPEALVQLCSEFGLPVIEHGKRNFFNFPTENPLHLGFNPSPFVEDADLIIAVECHVPWIPAFTNMKETPMLIQIGVDPLFHRIPMRGFPVDVSLAGDPAGTLDSLRNNLRVKLEQKKNGLRNTIQSRVEKAGKDHERVFGEARAQAGADSKKEKITKRFLSNCIGRVIDDETVIFNEYNLDPFQVPRRLTDSWFENSVASGLGWSLGAALGGKLASPEHTVVVTLGDGSYMFNTPMSAHFVAGAYEVPIMIVVFNDSAWSTIKMSTKGSHKDGWAAKTGSYALCDFNLNVKFEMLAEACGGVGLVVDKPADLIATLEKGLKIVRNEQKHVLVNVICERDG